MTRLLPFLVAVPLVAAALAVLVGRASDPPPSAAKAAPSSLQRATQEAKRHRFHAALRHARAAQKADPRSDAAVPVIVDSLVELGRLDQAAAELQRMIDAKPTLAGYARASYLRELRGDLDGAADAMRLAVGAGAGARRQGAAVTVLLGDVELRRRRRAAARRAYGEALAAVPGHAAARVGLARLDAAAGRYDRAIAELRAADARQPLTETLIELGETELAAGRQADAARTFGRVRASQRRERDAGYRIASEVGLFEAEHGDAGAAVALARAGWREAPTVRAADALAAALAAAGRGEEALRWARRALAGGWREPSALHHAGQAALAVGDRPLARRWLRAAIARADALGPWQTAQARRALAAASPRGR